MLAQLFGRGGWISPFQLICIVGVIALIIVYKVVKNKQ
jgi:hypothetical protein